MPRFLFDDVARLIGASGSRRGFLRVLSAGMLTGFAVTGFSASLSPPAAARKRQRKRLKCQKPGAGCGKGKPCCKGTRCVRGRCQCLAAKKRCGKACIPRAQCCPATDGACGNDNPTPCGPGGACCAGTKPCGQGCIAIDACCTASDCQGPCLTGSCVAGHCMLRERGDLCGESQNQRCNTAGVCAKTCVGTDIGTCQTLPVPTTKEQFCRRIVCEDGICEETHKNDHILLPEEFQIPDNCEALECSFGGPGGIGISEGESSESFNDFPAHPSQCSESYCHDISQPEVRFRHEGYPCGENGSMVCDGNGNCVP